ncbi:MAG: hypothetical protein Q4G69_13895 [Planctomycetia bacterium]|nr:hypothetical protein [Planctomycetia bacterium]
MMKWIASAALLTVFLTLILVFIQRARNIRYESQIAIQEKENKVLQIVPLELGAATAQQESFGPALMQYYNAIRKITPDDPLLPSRMEDVRQNYFFPQQLTEPSKGLIRSPKINEIVFSKKGDLFALLASATGEIWIWDTSSVKVVGKNRFFPQPGVQYTLRPNPLFEKGYFWEKGTTRPFMLVASSGYLAYVGFDTKQNTNPETGIVDLLTGEELYDKNKYESLPQIFKSQAGKKIIIRNEIRNPNTDFLDIPDRKEKISWKKFFDHQDTAAFLKKMDLSPADSDFNTNQSGNSISAMSPNNQIRIEIHQDILNHVDLTSGRRTNKSLALDDPFRPQPKGIVLSDTDRLIVWDGSLRSINPANLRTDRIFAESNSVCTALLAQNGGSRFAAVFENGDLAIYDSVQEKPLRRFSALFSPFSRILLGNDAKGITFAAADSGAKEIIRIDWNLEPEKNLSEILYRRSRH